ncbi:MAG: hypothetical protein BWZ06_01742 [Bacteroidetes bacterium ADurb.BinA261]|nr:MAG: hypothetical protein BWZ06_01742 [Bacteroidetes bacterium ADurb.BinA261]
MPLSAKACHNSAISCYGDAVFFTNFLKCKESTFSSSIEGNRKSE